MKLQSIMEVEPERNRDRGRNFKLLKLKQGRAKPIEHELYRGEKKEEELCTSIKPKEKRLLVDVVSGLEEPVEEGPAVALVDGHVPGVLPEADRRLSGEPEHAVGLLLLGGLDVQFQFNCAAVGGGIG